MIWLNGAAVDGAHAHFDLTDRGLLLGDGVFDTALVTGGKIVWRDAHVARLRDACHAIGIDTGAGTPGSQGAANVGHAGLLHQRIENAMTLASDGLDFGSIRVTVTRGPGPRGVAPPLVVTPNVIAARGPMARALAFEPLRLWSSLVQRNETSVTSRIKSLAYLDTVLETAKARAAGCDEALFLNTQGAVACCGVGNIFALIGGRLLTPPVEAGVLAGIARAAVLRLAKGLGVAAVAENLTPRDLSSAEAVFVTNSLRLLAPVTRVNDTVLRQAPKFFDEFRVALAQDAGLAL